VRVLPQARWPKGLPKTHASRWGQRFYVESGDGTVGLVPWPGSQIVWPWEQAWLVDMGRVTPWPKHG
jgi:hypothetical protein